VSVSERLGRLCVRYGDGELDDLDGKAASALKSVLRRIRHNKVGDELIPDLDVIEAAIVSRGSDGLTVPTRDTSSKGFRPLPGISAHPSVCEWTCPTGVCARRAIGTSPSDEPEPCAITEEPLKQSGLAT
jgi:hypothetical protein